MGIKITRKKIRDWIEAGYGQGHGAHYKPWLRLGRGRFIPKSKHGWYLNPVTGAQETIFSDNERIAGIVGKWLGAIDSRVQFPCFPFAHPHPLEDAPGREVQPLPWSRGTVALAHDAGIDHPVFPGTDIYYVLTFDVLFTLPPRARPSLAAVAGKDTRQTRAPEPAWNVVENLELQRRYAADISAPFLVWDQLVCPDHLAVNLSSIYSSAVIPESLACRPYYPEFLQFALARIDHWPVGKILQAFATKSGLSVLDVTFLFDHAAWIQDIPIDLTQPTLRSRPAPLWDGKWIGDMRQAMFGRREFA